MAEGLDPNRITRPWTAVLLVLSLSVPCARADGETHDKKPQKSVPERVVEHVKHGLERAGKAVNHAVERADKAVRRALSHTP